MTNVIAFPRRRPNSQIDLAELSRWAVAAPIVADWWVSEDPETGGWISKTDDGVENIALGVGGPHSDAIYCISVEPEGYVKENFKTGATEPFGTLREALESVCRTL